MDHLETNEADIHSESTARTNAGDGVDASMKSPARSLTAEEARLAESRRQQELKVDALLKLDKEKWMETEGGRLCMEFYRAFEAYKVYVSKNVLAEGHAFGLQGKYFEEHALFRAAFMVLHEYQKEQEEVRRRNLDKAKKAARCQHMHLNGQQCGSPRIRGRKLCYMHERMQEERPQKLDLGPLEDPDSIQAAIRKLQGAIIEGTLDAKTAGQLAYTIQLAAWNVTRTTDRRETGG